MVPNKHEKTRAAIFAKPDRRNIKFGDVDSLLISLGADTRPAKGDHRYYTIGEHTLSVDSGAKELPRYAVRNLREFLTKIGGTT